MRLVNVGLLTTAAESASVLRAHVRATGMSSVSVEVNEYCKARTDLSVRRFIDARPDVILIDGEDIAGVASSVQVLHDALPAAWILVCTSVHDANTILALVRAGARELIPSPITPSAVLQAIHRYNEERERERQSQSALNGKIYSVCSAKSGGGSTTVAMNVAAALAELPGSHVAMLDLAWPLGDAATFLRTTPRFTIADALGAASRLDSVLLENYMHKEQGVHVLPGFEDYVAGDVLNGAALTQLLELVTNTYTHAVMDMSAALPREVLQIVLSMSNTIAVVLTPDLLSVRRADRLLKLFARFDASDRVRLVLNRSKKGDEINERDIEKTLKQPVAWKIGNDYQACMQAVNSGSASVLATSKQLGKDFRDMSRQIAGVQNQDKRKGLLSLLPRTNL
jgi:pilus assembly protein CpaE